MPSTQNQAVEAIDLDAAADALASDYKAVANRIKRLRDVHSAHTDLTTAFGMINAVSSAAALAEKGTEWAQHAAPALVYSAVILYVRATKSRSDHRSTLDLRSKFDQREATFHERLCRLRDDALAHFGPGELKAGSFLHEERTILPLDRADDLRIVLASRRVLFAPSFVLEMKPHVHRAMLLAQREIEKRETALVRRIDELIDDDRFVAILKAHKINANELFAGHAAGAFLNHGDRQGVHSGLIWDQ